MRETFPVSVTNPSHTKMDLPLPGEAASPLVSLLPSELRERHSFFPDEVLFHHDVSGWTFFGEEEARRRRREGGTMLDVGVRYKGRGVLEICTYHPDTRLAFSVSVGEEGRVTWGEEGVPFRVWWEENVGCAVREVEG